MRWSCVILVLLVIGAAASQNAPAAPVKAARSSVREHLVHSANQRLLWEAMQTWGTPAILNTNSELQHPAIHMDQPPLTTPKIRREWLQPSSEPSGPEPNVHQPPAPTSSAYMPQR
ncbi:MAG TPA: hypothetical protein VG498_24220 [Terriglobales bacterium]|nr:hypothetical protein [Terriglobales bacterium]